MVLARPSLRIQLLLALVVPAGIVIFVVALRAERIASRSLENALESRLISVAQAAATNLNPRVTALGPGDDNTRTKRHALSKLIKLRDAVQVARLLVVRHPQQHILIDTHNIFPVGAPYRRAAFDRSELINVAAGRGAASLLFRSPSGEWFKTGYAPIRVNGTVTAYVAAQAPVTYGDALWDLRHRLLILGSLALATIAGAAALVASRVAQPLARLSRAAEAIGRGALNTPIPRGGPSEAVVLADTMSRMTKSLYARDEHMQMMLAGIAHEVRNPLGGIELFGGILREDLENDPRQANVDKILRELRVLSRVVNDFLDFARKSPPCPSHVNINTLVDECRHLLDGVLHERHIYLEVPSNDAPVFVYADREALQRTILNLMQNAIQAVPLRGTVIISLSYTAKDVNICVDDNGPGIPKENHKKIFTPFYTTKEKGTGLGLALAHQTAVAHNGTIRTEDSDLGGARFILTLPCTLETLQKTQ